MKTERLGIVMNGVTGRMGTNQHLVRSIAAIRAQGGSTDLDAALADPADAVYFDSASTGLRPGLIRRAIAAGKHVYTEKPVAPTLAEAVALHRAAEAAGVKHGVVQDKLWLPGLQKLRLLIDSGFFGRILSVRGEFGYWVFEGDWQPASAR